MKRLFLLLPLWLLSGCGPVPTGEQKELANSAPSSNLSLVAAKYLARKTVSSTDLEIFTVAATCSMLPTLDSSSVLLVEPWTGAALHINDIVIYEASVQNPFVAHRVAALSEFSFIPEGDANKSGDGWRAKSLIKFRVAGILFTNNHYKNDEKETHPFTVGRNFRVKLRLFFIKS